MKHILLTVLVTVLAGQYANAQIQIGDAEVPTMGSAGKLEDDDLEAFKKTTTVFVLQAGDLSRKMEFQKAIGDVWKITPFLVIMPDELRNYRDGRSYSYFGFGGFVVQSRNSVSSHLSYDLSIDKYNKKGEQKGRTLLARFLVSPDEETMSQTGRMVFGGKKDQGNMLRTLYTTARFTNWGPGYIKGYVRFVNDALMAKKRRGVFNGALEKDKITALATDTLFVPASLNSRFNKFTGSESADDKDDEDLAKAYPYKIQYVEDDLLQQRILNATKPIYYVMYVRSSSDKHVSVFEGLSGQLVYADYTPMSYNFKMKDLKKIAKEIR